LQAEICAMADEPNYPLSRDEYIAKHGSLPANKMHKRSAAAKKGWATRRANAQQVAS
jgi:hypothetical protein